MSYPSDKQRCTSNLILDVVVLCTLTPLTSGPLAAADMVRAPLLGDLTSRNSAAPPGC